MRNQSEEILKYIEDHPGASTGDIVEGTGWNRRVVEVATELMLEAGLITETGRTQWNDPRWTTSLVSTYHWGGKLP